MADEAHRTQYAKFAQNVTAALPHATRIGFTGTPIEQADRSTQVRLRRLHLCLPDGTRSRRSRHRADLLRVAPDPARVEDERATARSRGGAGRRGGRGGLAGHHRLDATREVVGDARAARASSRTTSQTTTAGAAKDGGKAMVVAMSQRIAAELTGLLTDAASARRR